MSHSAAGGTDVTDTTALSRLDVIRLVGDVLTELDVLRSRFDRNTDKRTELAAQKIADLAF